MTSVARTVGRPETPPTSRVLTNAVLGLLLLAIAYTLYFAADLLVPIAIAIFLNVLLSPVVRRAEKTGVPPSVSAAVLVIALVSLAVTCVSVLAEPAERWLADAPTSIRELRHQLLPATGSLSEIQELAEEVEELTKIESGNSQSVVVEGPGILEGLIGGLPAMLASAVIVVFLTYFLLASGDTLLRRMCHCGRTWSARRRLVAITRQIQEDLAHYLATVTLINLVLGALVALAMKFLQVPNPLLWGAMVTVFNFAPYVGALTSAMVLTVVGLTTFPTLSDALTVPGVFLVLTVLEGQLITPAVLGRRMSLSATIVFVSVLVWGWLWGIAGALMAVPIVTAFKVICDHVPALHFLGSFVRSYRTECRELAEAHILRSGPNTASLSRESERASG